MSWALSQPARSTTGAYYEVAASPRGDALLWYPGTGPPNTNNATPGVLGSVSFFVNKIAFKGRWRVVVRQFAATRDVSPTSGVLWRKDVRKREVDPLMRDLVAKIEAGTFSPEQAINGIV